MTWRSRFQRHVITPWVILHSPRIYVIRWRRCCNSAQLLYEAVNGTKASAIREGLQEIVWRHGSVAAPAKHEQIHSYWVSLLWTHKGGFCAGETAVSCTNNNNSEIWGRIFRFDDNKHWGTNLDNCHIPFVRSVIALLLFFITVKRFRQQLNLNVPTISIQSSLLIILFDVWEPNVCLPRRHLSTNRPPTRNYTIG